MSSQLASLKEKIDAKRRLIAALPDWSSVSERAHVYEKANHINQLTEQEEEYELLVEAKRIESVVRIHKEMHPPVIERCPLCLDDVEIKSHDSMYLFACPCAILMCAECTSVETTLRMEGKCPLCRADYPKSEEQRSKVFIKAAKNGRPAAQFMLGDSYHSGTNGVPLDKEESVRWYKLAAEGNHLGAIYELALLYKEGDGVKQSDPKALELMTKAADMGWARAQMQLANWYSFSATGLSMDLSKAVHYNTLACNQTEDDVKDLADYHLGTKYFIGEGGLPESLFLAKYYLGRAALNGLEEAYCSYAVVMLLLWKSQHCDNKGFLHLPGHSVIPKCLYWMRKAAANGNAVAICNIKEITMDGQSLCSYCMTPAAELSGQLKQCATCKGAWYCSRNCQVQAWRAGHKIDCVTSD